MVAVLVRFPRWNESFWLDEAAQAIESSRAWSQQLDIAEDFQPPLFHLWLFLFARVSSVEWWLRLASMIPALGALAFTFMTLKEQVEKRYVAHTVTFLLAISSLHVWFSQELRPYMFAVWWGAVSWWMWSRVVRQGKPAFWWQSCVLVLSLAGGMLSSYVFLFWAAALWVVTVGVYRSQAVWFTRVASVSGIWWLLWWPGFWEQWQVGSALRADLPGWDVVVSSPWLKSLPLTLAKFLTGVLEVDLNAVFVVLLSSWYLPVAGVAAWQLFRWLRRLVSEEERWVTAQWLIVSAALSMAWVVTMITPILAPKRILFILPVMLTAAIATRFPWRWLTAWIIASYALWQGVGLWSTWTQPRYQRENWRELVQTVETRFSPLNSGAVFAFAGPFAPWRWYQQEGIPTVSTGLIPLSSHDQAVQALSPAQAWENILVFDYLRDLTDPQDFISQVLREWGYDEIGVIEYPGIGFVRVWQRQKQYAWMW